ncbi:MAG: hypothetical protein AAF243_13935 [Cyanobacteria bacterium P01_A01_bin.137]
MAAPGFTQTELTNQSRENAPEATSLTPDAVIAQRRGDDDNRINYFGVGGTIGVSDDGDTELGDGGFSLVGRFSFNETLSIHSASVFGGDNLSTFALTTGWPVTGDRSERVKLFPFVGAGVGVEFDNFEISPVVTAGVDVPINDLITGTARVNAAFNDGTDIGVILGVGVDVLGLF